MKTKANPEPMRAACPKPQENSDYPGNPPCIQNLQYESTVPPARAEDDRVLLVREILKLAIESDIETFKYRIGMLDGSQLLSLRERMALGSTLTEVRDFTDEIEGLFEGEVTRIRRLHVQTFLDDVSALREIAFWSCDRNQTLEMERLIFEVRRSYEAVLRIWHVTNETNPIMWESVPVVPNLPPNPYLKISHPEVAA